MQRKIAWVLFLSLLVTSYSLLVTDCYPEEETLTITTYYPSPYGSYRELRSQRMAIGENWYEGSNVCWDDDPTSCTGTYPQTKIPVANDVELVVEGNVGIGTAAPYQKLDVAGNIGLGLQNITTSRYVGLYNGAGDFGASSGASIQFTSDADGAGYSNAINFQTSHYVTSYDTRMTIDKDGDVGIGTTGPDYKLHIEGGSVNVNNADWSRKAVLGGDGTGVYGSGSASGVYAITNGSAGSYGLMAMDGGGAGAIKASGNVHIMNGKVGIGTTNPDAKLEVDGGIKIGNDTASCDATKKGTIRWAGNYFQGCNGASWVNMLGNYTYNEPKYGGIRLCGDYSGSDPITWKQFCIEAGWLDYVVANYDSVSGQCYHWNGTAWLLDGAHCCKTAYIKCQ